VSNYFLRSVTFNQLHSLELIHEDERTVSCTQSTRTLPASEAENGDGQQCNVSLAKSRLQVSLNFHLHAVDTFTAGDLPIKCSTNKNEMTDNKYISGKNNGARQQH
jgi:hypothetical protein